MHIVSTHQVSIDYVHMQVSRSDVFQEVTLELVVTPELRLHYDTTIGVRNDRWNIYHCKIPTLVGNHTM